MTERRPLVLIDNTPTVLPPGDTLPGAGGGAVSDINNVTYQWDFLNSTTNADIWTGGAISGGNVSGSVGTMMSSNHPGVVRIASAATANSGYRFTSGTNNANGGLLVSEGVRLTAIFAAPGGTVESYVGILNATTASEPSTGAYIHIQDLTVTAKTAQGGSSTSAALGTISADTFYTLTIEASFTGGFVFEIRNTAGSLVATATITTTLPISVTGCGITAYTTTATSQACAYIDYMRLQIPSLARG